MLSFDENNDFIQNNAIKVNRFVMQYLGNRHLRLLLCIKTLFLRQFSKSHKNYSKENKFTSLQYHNIKAIQTFNNHYHKFSKYKYLLFK